MAKTKETPCKFYICEHECEKGRDAEHNGYCQRCKLYTARARVKHPNLKKLKLNKIKENERE